MEQHFFPQCWMEDTEADFTGVWYKWLDTIEQMICKVMYRVAKLSIKQVILLELK